MNEREIGTREITYGEEAYKPRYKDADEEAEEQFTISNAGQADWAVEKIKEENARSEEFISACRYKIDACLQQITDRKAKAESNNEYLLSLLKQYMQNAPTKKAKNSESLELPSGKVRLTYSSIKLVPDRAKLIEKLQDTDFIETKQDVKWGEFKKLLRETNGTVIRTDTGEEIDGVAIEITEAEMRVE